MKGAVDVHRISFEFNHKNCDQVEEKSHFFTFKNIFSVTQLHSTKSQLKM